MTEWISGNFRNVCSAASLVRMRVQVDESKCQGHNRCMVVAPGLFDIDEMGTASPAGDGVVPAGREQDARLAVENCPEYAISITDD